MHQYYNHLHEKQRKAFTSRIDELFEHLESLRQDRLKKYMETVFTILNLFFELQEDRLVDESVPFVRGFCHNFTSYVEKTYDQLRNTVSPSLKTYLPADLDYAEGGALKIIYRNPMDRTDRAYPITAIQSCLVPPKLKQVDAFGKQLVAPNNRKYRQGGNIYR